jgi:hypothetical protein
MRFAAIGGVFFWTPNLRCSRFHNAVCRNFNYPIMRFSAIMNVYTRWRCTNCQTTMQALYRGFGQWPSPGFKDLPKTVREEFYSEMAGKPADESRSKVQSLLKSFETHEENYAEQGEFLPLSVWARRGFDAEAITRDSTDVDIRDNVPQLGRCYRVRICSTGLSGRRGMERSHTETAGGKSSQMGRAIKRKRAELAADVAEPKAPADSDDDASSDPSSSSSSSSSGKKKKNKNKNKKEKKKSKKAKKLAAKEKKRVADEKQKVKDVKQSETATQKRMEATTKLATAILPKAMIIKQAMDGLLANTGCLTRRVLWHVMTSNILLRPGFVRKTQVRTSAFAGSCRQQVHVWHFATAGFSAQSAIPKIEISDMRSHIHVWHVAIYGIAACAKHASSKPRISELLRKQNESGILLRPLSCASVVDATAHAKQDTSELTRWAEL